MRWYQGILLSLFFISCRTENKPSFEKAWIYNDDLSEKEQLENVDRYGSTMESGFSGASFLNLQPDGKFTSYFSAFDYGHWALKDSTLLLIDHNKGRLFLEVKKLES